MESGATVHLALLETDGQNYGQLMQERKRDDKPQYEVIEICSVAASAEQV